MVGDPPKKGLHVLPGASQIVRLFLWQCRHDDATAALVAQGDPKVPRGRKASRGGGIAAGHGLSVGLAALCVDCELALCEIEEREEEKAFMGMCKSA